MKRHLTKLARIENRLQEAIEEVTLYKAPNGKLYDTIEDAVTSIIAPAVRMGIRRSVKPIARAGAVARIATLGPS